MNETSGKLGKKVVIILESQNEYLKIEKYNI